MCKLRTNLGITLVLHISWDLYTSSDMSHMIRDRFGDVSQLSIESHPWTRRGTRRARTLCLTKSTNSGGRNPILWSQLTAGKMSGHTWSQRSVGNISGQTCRQHSLFLAPLLRHAVELLFDLFDELALSQCLRSERLAGLVDLNREKCWRWC